LKLHIYKTVKDFKASSLFRIAVANVRIMKKNRGLYHVSERRYLNVSSGTFFGYTCRAGCTVLAYSCTEHQYTMFLIQQWADSSLEGPHRKENMLMIQTQHKSLSESDVLLLHLITLAEVPRICDTRSSR
jgi:hypothetical protein